jgi:hypothetical protein
MREPDKCSLDYCGYLRPRTESEMNIELLGLKNLIKRAEERISMLEQSMYIAKYSADSAGGDKRDI